MAPMDEMLGMMPGILPAVGFGGMPRMPVPQRPMNPYQRLREIGYMSRMARMGLPMRNGQYNPGRMPGMLDTSTGFNPDVADTGAMNQLLQGFGQHMPENPSPYAMLPNSGFFGQHQRLGGMLEGGLFGAANTPSAQTWGEGINAVARGILGGTAERARAINQQYSQPFQQAQQVGQLMQMQQMMQLEKSRAAQQDALAQKELRAPNGAKYYAIHTVQDPKDPNYGKLAGFLPGEEEKGVQILPGQGGFSKPAASKNDYGGGFSAGMKDLFGTMTDESGQPLDPTKKPSPAIVAKAYKQIQAQLMSRATASAGVGAASRAELQDRGFEHTDIDEAYKNSIIKPNTKTSELVRDYGNDALQPGFIQAHNDSVDRAFGKGKYANQPNNMFPRKAPSQSGNKPTVITLPSGKKVTIE